VLWFALAVIAAAGTTYVALRFWSDRDLRSMGEPGDHLEHRGHHEYVRPWAPDDDDEFLRELDRRRLHGDE
jgi:hypothetical protein